MIHLQPVINSHRQLYLGLSTFLYSKYSIVEPITGKNIVEYEKNKKHVLGVLRFFARYRSEIKKRLRSVSSIFLELLIVKWKCFEE